MAIPRHKAHRLLDASRPLYARVEIKEGDYTFAVGELVPWEALGWRLEHVRAMFRVRYLDHRQLVDVSAGPDDGVAPDALPLTDALGNRTDALTLLEPVATEPAQEEPATLPEPPATDAAGTEPVASLPAPTADRRKRR